MDILLLTPLLFGFMLLLLFLGLPIVFALGGSAVILGLITQGPSSLLLATTAILNNIRTIVLIAVPLFIFMGNLLKVSGLAEDLYSAAEKWIGGVRGGLAVGTVLICTIFAACTGVSGAATITMGLIAVPSMLKRGYDRKLALGCVMGGGALGQLIPPSLLFILYGFLANESVGRLFASGFVPGLILSGLFIAYILIACHLKGSLGPATPSEDRGNWKEKVASLRSIIMPSLLIVAVLGSIFSGLATPTEAAAVGALGALIILVINGRLTWPNLKEALYGTFSLTAMVMWIVVGATVFTTIFTIAGGSELVKSLLLEITIAPIWIVVVMQLTLFVLGCFIDPTGILMLTVPIYVPVVKALGFDTVWFGALFVLNMEMAFLTPPYGVNLFYIRGITPPEIPTTDIYRSALAFVGVQATALILVLLFPQLALWLPNLLFGAEK
ncbi:MAG: TRAP dicarboxylate transporter subunit DctM [candidate division NC10 bacterium RIFCSPLOWO2_12_FULL_66_18]|nr:MAG: TRAP dicarboxylate transporter subunit DctM [candidate division NC10 bacterium RIFCSPLOWO2_02_FULL_66_22]OGC01588.1 MAG: TRAP dicarboxylate transporter subunit DctM [candidate division NC10 bacterium RIFCSPLOWO2_12_FULL_66_18]